MNNISKKEIFWQKHLSLFIPFVSELYPLTKFQLLQYEELWDWERIQLNPFIKWDNEMNTYFANHFINLIIFPRKEISVSLVNPEYYFQFFHDLPEITLNNIYFRESEEERDGIKIYWKDILFGSYKVEEFGVLEENKLMLLVNKFNCGIDLNEEQNWEIAIPTKFLEKYRDEVNWKELSGYYGLKWSFKLLQQFQDYWITERLIQNHTAFNYCLKDDLNDEFIEKVLN